MRNLTSTEIATLTARNCTAQDWSRILVAEEFSAGNSFQHVHFSGDIQLGTFTKTINPNGPIPLPTGITNSRLHNTTIGNNCRINASTLANTDVLDDTIIDTIGELSHNPEDNSTAPFGNNAAANTLSEDGARAIPLWRHLSAQLAHLLCHYKEDPVTQSLRHIITKDCQSLPTDRSHVGKNCTLRRIGKLQNVYIGDNATIAGAGYLQNCYVEGGPAPAKIGEGVSAKNCVFQAASTTTSGARLECCLVGEGAILEQALFAEHSTFFANTYFKLGEAVSVLAGPFTESHHKATLVLTCQSSFSTFGSGSNSSNHHFKLGPRHGGVLRRGTRCGSGSYLYWPCDIGAFSTIVGRHTEHLETADFPFSLLLATGKDSVLVPGVHLFGAGIYRDGFKWQERDRRTAVEEPLDLVNSAVLSPYIMQAIKGGICLLNRSEGLPGDLRHGGAIIPKHRIQPAIRLYKSGLLFYSGECLLRNLVERGDTPNTRTLAKLLEDETVEGYGYTGGTWRDWGGMLLSGRDAKAFTDELTAGGLTDWRQIHARLREIHGLYSRRELEWAAWHWRDAYGEIRDTAIEQFIEQWRQAVEYRFECTVKDAAKEFTREMTYGYGIEGPAKETFLRIRGDVNREPVVYNAQEERTRLVGLAAAFPSGA